MQVKPANFFSDFQAFFQEFQKKLYKKSYAYQPTLPGSRGITRLSQMRGKKGGSKGAEGAQNGGSPRPL